MVQFCLFSRIISIFSIRYEYFNKGVDLYIEALARLNYFLKVSYYSRDILIHLHALLVLTVMKVKINSSGILGSVI